MNNYEKNEMNNIFYVKKLGSASEKFYLIKNKKRYYFLVIKIGMYNEKTLC